MLTFDSSSLTSLSPSDRILFNQFSRGRTTTVPFQCIHHAIHHQSLLNPHSIAIEHPSLSTSITYSKLSSISTSLAHILYSEYNIRPKQRVCIIAKRSIENIIATLAVLKCGAQYVPIDGVNTGYETIDYMVRDSGCDLVLAMRDFVHLGEWDKVLCVEDGIMGAEFGGVKDELDITVDGDHGVYMIYTSGGYSTPTPLNVRNNR
jgi:acyl-CoA synthetase (AMP-forming)/AMP-acid ligase II